MQSQFLGIVPIPLFNTQDQLDEIVHDLLSETINLKSLIDKVIHRLEDFAPAAKHVAPLRNWPNLTFKAFSALIAKYCKAEIPVGKRDQWEHYLTEKRAEAAALAAAIADAEAEINARVYRLFDLSGDDIALIEATIAGQY